MCRAVRVLCVAPDDAELAALKRASVGAGWELAPGATDLRSALDQIDVERPHAIVVFGPFDDLVALAAERFPGIRIVTDRDTPGASAVAGSPDDVRDLLAELPRPGGPVR
jgi:alkanesulfonate monooxygenase SsuD/methylene tetrahydromethanopterin reductase-like flavin-dependent oxidoreductase (luciferase family)